MGHGFVPSESKLEAVARISDLTDSGPETLGPGSKERKSVLINLARGFGLAVDENLSKPQLGAAIADQLGAHWDRTCWSSGSTITLVGLDRLLEAAARRRPTRRARAARRPLRGPQDEAEAIVRALIGAIGDTWDGRECVAEMRDAEYSHWAQDKWAGWYFEFKGLPQLINQLGGGPQRILNTTFDYGLTSIWDLKVHSGDGLGSGAILNDRAAIEAVLDSGVGLGFVVLCGDRVDDEGEFREWQRQQRLAAGKIPIPRRRPAEEEARQPRRATSSPAFKPTRIDVFYLRDPADLARAIKVRALTEYHQGAQQTGGPRKTKYQLRFSAAREALLLTSSETNAVPVPRSTRSATLCRLEYLTAEGWVVGHAGIHLLSPARYVERLTERGKFGRCTELNPDMTVRKVHTSPNPPHDLSILMPDPPYRIPKIRGLANP